ncbi:MAG: fumarylacetoacetate hydrolase family protein [Sphingopyxis sp.]|nr:fumarylacetoacetate hydrolase family protein [Sphingopyxis sp.]
MTMLNATHNPDLLCWEPTANGDTDFPIQNLPFGRFRRPGRGPQGGVAIGDKIVDLAALLELELLKGDAEAAARAGAGDDLLPLLRLGNGPASALRARLSDLLSEGGASGLREAAGRVLVAQADVEMLLPTTVRQFSDMCVSTFHIGRRNGNDDRGQPICPPVFRTLPVGYDGRASSIVVSGTPVHRPNGTWQESFNAGDLAFGPEPRQDYELEVGLWFGGEGNSRGQPLSMAQASDALFGMCLLNDWSSRGIQFWETMLGPFLGKSMATTISPWIVTVEALAPFRVPAFARPAGDPPVPAHLNETGDQQAGGFDIALTSRLQTKTMRGAGVSAQAICKTNFRHMYWTFAQMVAHHASNGCSLAAGDLLGSGTCSGPEMAEAACLAESLVAGSVKLDNGETREWLEDGDTIVLEGRAMRDGYASIGFGKASGQIIPAPDWPT